MMISRAMASFISVRQWPLMGRSEFVTARCVLNSGMNKRSISYERNLVQSPFGKVEIPNQNVTQYIFEGYEKYADKPAITCGASKRSYTYGTTYEMVKRMARGLLSQKGCAMRKNDVLGLLLPNIPEFVPALHGGLLAGLSVTFANPLYTPEEVCRQFENAGVTAIVTLPMLLPVAEMFKLKVKQYRGTICIGGKHDLEKNIYGFEQFLMEDHSSELPEVDCNSTAILPYSSGTTGLPKGVELTHYNLVANLAQGSHPKISKYYTPEYADRKETILTIPPYFHIYGLNAILHSVLKSKNHIISIPRYLYNLLPTCTCKNKVLKLFRAIRNTTDIGDCKTCIILFKYISVCQSTRRKKNNNGKYEFYE